MWLCDALVEVGRLDDARSILEHSLNHPEMVPHKNPHDPWVKFWKVHHFRQLAQVARFQGKNDEWETYTRRAVDGSTEMIGVMGPRHAFIPFVESRQELARLCMIQERYDEAARLIFANRQMLEFAPAEADVSHVANVLIGVEGDLLQLLLLEPTALTSNNLAIAFESGGPLSTILSASEIASPDEWGAIVLRTLWREPNRGERNQPEVSIGYRLIEILGQLAARQRHRGKQEESRQTADRLVVLGRLLVGRFPDEPTAHLALADAYMQCYKNAWRNDDRAALELNLKRSLDATRRALALDPRNRAASDLVAQRQRRLEQLRPLR
jgi:hypothetical protein